MRIARRLLLLCATALAATALTATNAAAQEAVEVINEATEAHCSVALDNCEVHATNESLTTIVNHNFLGEFTVSQCNEEFIGSFNEDGSGHAFLTANDHATNDACTTEQCAEAGEREWPISGAAETSPNAGIFTVTFCLFSEVTGSDSHCTVQVDISETTTPHQYEIRAIDDGCLGAGQADNEVTGHWLTEVDPQNFDEVEVVHQ